MPCDVVEYLLAPVRKIEVDVWLDNKSRADYMGRHNCRTASGATAVCRVRGSAINDTLLPHQQKMFIPHMAAFASVTVELCIPLVNKMY